MSLGTYSIPAGGSDDQVPHREDEIYVVVRGRAVLLVGGERLDVAAGSAVYVSAGTVHRFVDVVEDLTVLVVFAPPYSGR
jgi:mannose-6-phosphate isomerase-like protein (cupin superfamily)